jgi:hypothetical protein
MLKVRVLNNSRESLLWIAWLCLRNLTTHLPANTTMGASTKKYIFVRFRRPACPAFGFHWAGLL